MISIWKKRQKVSFWPLLKAKKLFFSKFAKLTFTADVKGQIRPISYAIWPQKTSFYTLSTAIWVEYGQKLKNSRYLSLLISRINNFMTIRKIDLYSWGQRSNIDLNSPKKNTFLLHTYSQMISIWEKNGKRLLSGYY